MIWFGFGLVLVAYHEPGLDGHHGIHDHVRQHAGRSSGQHLLPKYSLMTLISILCHLPTKILTPPFQRRSSSLPTASNNQPLFLHPCPPPPQTLFGKKIERSFNRCLRLVSPLILLPICDLESPQSELKLQLSD